MTEMSARCGHDTGGHGAPESWPAILDDAVRDRLLVANPARGVQEAQGSGTAAQRVPERGSVEHAGRRVRAVPLAGAAARASAACAGVRRPRCGRATSTSCAAASSCTATLSAWAASSSSARLKSGKSRTVVVPAFVINALAQTAEGKGREDLMWPRRGRVAICRAGHSRTPGCRARWRAARRPIRRSRGSLRTRCGTRRHRWRSVAGANPKVVQRMLGHA